MEKMAGSIEIASLNIREQLVLQHIIRQYISTANPVGSRTVSKQMELNLSPASIRNIMSDLEEKGLIGHPHTSSGRIPTDKGYRFYVDTISHFELLSVTEQELIEHRLEDQRLGTLEAMVRESGRILSRISQQLAIVSTPLIGKGVLQHLELVPVASNRLMVVLSISSGFIKTIVFDIEADLPRETLEQLTSFLNERLCGLSLREIRESFADRIRDAAPDAPTLIELFLQSGDRLFADELDSARVYVEGIASMVQQPEFGDSDRLRNIIELVENRNIIVHLIDSIGSPDTISILIGSEIEEQKLHDYSIIAATYRVGPVGGTISLIGPRRMNYPKLISIVDYLAKCISQIASHQQDAS